MADVEPFSAELLKGAADAIRDTGFELLVYSASGQVANRVGWERRYLSRLSGTLIDGAMLVTPTVVDVHHGAPIVAVDPHTGPSTLPTVDSDNLRGAELAVEHLLALGHRRIAMLTGRPDLQSAALREQGYRQALAAAGVAVDESLVRSAPTTRRPRPRPRAGCSPPPSRRPPSSPPTTCRPSRRSARPRDLGPRVPARPLGGGLRQHPRVGAQRRRR